MWRDAILQALSELPAPLQCSNTQETSQHCCSPFFWNITINLTAFPYTAGQTHSTLFPGSGPPVMQARDIQKEPMLSSLPALLGVLPEVTRREGTWWGSHKSHPDLISWSCAHPFADLGSSSVRQRQTELSFSVVATHMYILMPSCSTVKLRHFPCFCCFY